MPVKRATPYYSVVLDATVGLAQTLNPSIRSTLSKNGHVLTLYNISESDISQIRFPSPDGKSNQNIHFEGIAVYSAAQSPLDIIRVYGLSGIVGQTYRQQEGSAYTKLSTEATFQPWLNLSIPRLTDELSAIGNNAGVSQSTIGIPKLFSITLGNSSDRNTSTFNPDPLIVAGSIIAVLGIVYKAIPREDDDDDWDDDDDDMPRFGKEAEPKLTEAEEAEEEAIAQEAATQAETLAAQEAAEEAETEAAADETAAGTEEAEEEEDLEADLDEDLV